MGFLLYKDSMSNNFMKIRSGINFGNLSSDPASANSGDVYFNTSTNTLRSYNGTSWSNVGSGAGSGGGGSKNYLSTITTSNGTNNGNGDFELGTTTGWSLGHSTVASGVISGVPTFGSGASANLSISTVTGGTQLAGTYSLDYVDSVATVAGDFLASDAFYIDNESKSSILNISFDYEVFSAVGGDFSGTSTSSFGVAIYDVTNSAWIQPLSNPWGLVQNSGIGGVSLQFQTTLNSTQYRLVVYNANATSGAVTIYFDSFSISPQVQVVGGVKNTLNLLVTSQLTLTQNAWNLINFQSASGDSTSGYSAGVFTCTDNSDHTVSASLLNNTSSGASSYISIYHNGASYRTSDGTTGALTSQISATIPCVIGDTLEIKLYPTTASPVINIGSNSNESFCSISWEGNIQLNPPVGAPVVAAQYSEPSGTISNTPNLITFGTEDSNTGIPYVSGIATVNASGRYFVYATIRQTGTYAAGGNFNIYIYHNGSVHKQQTFVTQAAISGDAFPVNIFDIIPCNAGDTISFYCSNQATSPAWFASDSDSYFSISMLPSMAATYNPVLAMRYIDTSGQSVGTSATLLSFATKTFDTIGSWSGNTFTVNVPGIYRVRVKARTGIIATTGVNMALYLYHNGSQYNELCYLQTAITGASWDMRGDDEVNSVTGDTISVYGLSTTATTLNTSAGYNYISIEKVR